jgi:hypothetical protein
MGMELFGFSTSGRYDTLLNNPAKPGPCNCHPHEEPHVSREPHESSPAPPSQGGLRVRVNQS